MSMLEHNKGLLKGVIGMFFISLILTIPIIIELESDIKHCEQELTNKN